MSSEKSSKLSAAAQFLEGFGGAIFLFCWISGVVLAQGNLKWAAVFFPPYSFYLFVERILVLSGFIG